MFVRAARGAVLAVLALAIAVPGVAARARSIEITLDANFATGVETFTAEGGFCPSGSAASSDLRINGGGSGLSFHVTKVLTCDDSTGSITIEVDAATHAWSPQDQGGWSVSGGSGDWASARGGGSVVGLYNASGVVDVYVGSLRS